MRGSRSWEEYQWLRQQNGRTVSVFSSYNGHRSTWAFCIVKTFLFGCKIPSMCAFNPSTRIFIPALQRLLQCTCASLAVWASRWVLQMFDLWDRGIIRHRTGEAKLPRGRQWAPSLNASVCQSSAGVPALLPLLPEKHTHTRAHTKGKPRTPLRSVIALKMSHHAERLQSSTCIIHPGEAGAAFQARARISACLQRYTRGSVLPFFFVFKVQYTTWRNQRFDIRV